MKIRSLALSIFALLLAFPVMAQLPPGAGVAIGYTPVQYGTNGMCLVVTNGKVGQTACGTGTGTVTSVSVTTANGVSGVVANPTTTPAITLTLGAITPSSVAPTGLTTLVGLAETFQAPAITANVLTIDLSTGTVFNVANTANITTMTLTNVPASLTSSFTLLFTANGSGFTQVYMSGIKWAAGVAPTLTTTNGKIDALTFVTYNGGTNWLGFVGGLNF